MISLITNLLPHGPVAQPGQGDSLLSCRTGVQIPSGPLPVGTMKWMVILIAILRFIYPPVTSSDIRHQNRVDPHETFVATHKGNT